MAIKSKDDLKFYISADLCINRGCLRYSFSQKIIRLFRRDHVISYLKALRKTEYFINTGKKKSFGYLINRAKLSSLGMKLGFSIAPNVFGYGLVIPHYGTIVVGDGNKVGSFAVLHTSTCITSGKKVIGDGLYLSCGAKIINDVSLGDAVTVGANAVVNKSFDSNALLTGIPAIEKATRAFWYENDGEKYQKRVEKIKALAAEKKRIAIFTFDHKET